MEIEDKKFYETSIIKDLIDYYWEGAKSHVFRMLVLHFFPLSALTAYAIALTDIQIANQILILVLIASIVLFVVELLQVSVSVKDYLRDPWNWLDFLYIAFQFVLFVVCWDSFNVGTAYEDFQTFIISAATLFTYVRLIVLMRVFDRMRFLVRMIMEVFKDLVSFFTVVLLILFAMTVAIYQTRKVDPAQQEFSGLTFGQNIQELYDSFFGDWDRARFHGVSYPFLIILTLLVHLVLFNLVISIMAKTHEKVMEDRISIDAKERLSMILEVMCVKRQVHRILRYFRLKKRRPFQNEGAEASMQYLLVFKRRKKTDLDEDEIAKASMIDEIVEKVTKRDEKNAADIHSRMSSVQQEIELKFTQEITRVVKIAQSSNEEPTEEVAQMIERVKAMEKGMEQLEKNMLNLQTEFTRFAGKIVEAIGTNKSQEKEVALEEKRAAHLD